MSLLGLPEENDWVLLSNYNDKSFMRNLLAFHIFEKMGHYAPRARLCEVVANGSYRGIYLFAEKIKRDKNRVDIAKIKPEDNSGEEVTGGYIFKVDYRDDDAYWTSKYSPIGHSDYTIHFVQYYPDSKNITSPQQHYIQNFTDDFEDALYTRKFDDHDGYRSYIDVSSFIDYFLVNEVSRNNDGFKKSRYFHKDKNGLIHAGPVWDFDWAWKNISECPVVSSTNGSGWAYHINDCNPWVKSPGWMIKMIQDKSFSKQLACRYYDLRESILSEDYLFHFADSIAMLLENAQERHFKKYAILGKNVGAPEVDVQPETYVGEVEKLKTWISKRLNWLDRNMIGDCDGYNHLLANDKLFIYPNPATERIHLSSVKTFKGLTIYSATGQLYFQKSIYSKDGMEVDISSLPAGLYILRAHFTDGSVVSGKILVN